MRKKVSTLQDYQKFNQNRLLKYIDTLEEKERDKIIEKLESINIANLMDVYAHQAKKENVNLHLQPIKNVLKLNQLSSAIQQQYEKIGQQLISEGKVCIAMMAGGQGTRLGFNKAKGMYDIGLPSHKTLFQVFCERIISLQNLIHQNVGKCLPIQFFIMTSDVNHEETTQYFLENKFFGLQSDQITFFQQDSLPILSKEGEILFSSQKKVLEGPDGNLQYQLGNGGIYSSLYNQGYLDYMKCLGIKYIHICPVDNILCKLSDPIWIGYLETQNLIIGSKYVKKAYAEEKVGIHALINDKPSIIEYSEMTQDDLKKTNDKGEIYYDAGGIGQMVCTLDFLYQIVTDPETVTKLAAKYEFYQRRYHVAQKKYEYFDFEQQQQVVPNQVNCLKFELFYFDCFPLCENEKFGLMEVAREDEFAPVKNAPGEKSDTPESARKLYLDRDRRWLKKYNFPQQQETEISADVTYFGEGLDKILPQYQGNNHTPLIINKQIQQQQQIKPKQPTQIKSLAPQQQQQYKQTPLPSVVYQPLVNSLQLPHMVQQNYYPIQQTQPRNILVQEIHQSQIINPRLSLQSSTQSLKKVKASAFPNQNLPLNNPLMNKQSSIVTFSSPIQHQFGPGQRALSPKQITSTSPSRLTLYNKPRATTVQRPTMFVQTRPLIVQAQTYCPLVQSVKK